MKNRFRVEIYDDQKSHDLTIFSEQGVDKEYLTEIVFSNLTKFEGRVRAYVYDTIKKKKTTALMIDESIVNKVKSIPKPLNAEILGLI